MSKLLFKLFHAAPEGGEGGLNIAPAIGGKTSDKDDVIDFLGQDDDDKKIEVPDEDKIDLAPPKKKDKPEDEEEDDKKKDEEDEDDEELDLESLLDDDEEPGEDKLELAVPVRRKDILKKYPELFKEFPYLEKAYYREQQFTSILPTIDDAKEAVEAKQTLDKFEKELMDGKIETILSSVKLEDGNSFYKIIDDLLPAIARVDEGAYHHLVGNTIKHTLLAMVQEAHTSKNETLMAAAHVLNQYVFGTTKFAEPTSLAKNEVKQPDGKEEELSRREQEFNRRQFETARADLNTRVNNSITAVIEQNIDPKETMTDYVKRNAIRQVTEELGSLVKKDARFGQIINRLWENSFKNGFSKESQDKIRTAYLSKARTLLPSVIEKARREALKGMGKRVREDNDETPVKGSKSERPRSKDSSGNKDKSVPRGMSTLDFLSQD